MNTLIHDLNRCVSKELTLTDLYQKIADLIMELVQNKSFKPQEFEEYFGVDAKANYLTPSQTQQLKNQLEKPGSPTDRFDGLVKLTTTVAFNAALSYACYKGCLPFAKYLVEVQKVSADHVGDLNSMESHFNIKSKTMKKKPLNLAVKSGNVQMVRYIYDSSNALVELPQKENLKPTLLMVAAKNGWAEIIRFLIGKGANPNASLGAYGTTPLKTALNARQPKAARTLINAGAILSNSIITEALELGYEFSFINYLIQNNVEKECGYSSFLIAAIKGGNVDTLKELERHPEVMPVDEVKLYLDQPIERALLSAALSSGSMEMVHYIQSKGIAAKDWVQKEHLEFVAFLNSANTVSDMKEIDIRHKTLVCKAYEGDVKRKRVLVLKFVLEELGVHFSDQELQFILKGCSSLKMVAYMQSQMTECATEKETLSHIAFKLEQLDLMRLFELYNCSLIASGNTFYDQYNRYPGEIDALIKEKLGQDTVAWVLNSEFNGRPEALNGALFYFSISEYEKQPQHFMHLLNRALTQKAITSVDVQNCNGETLAKRASIGRYNSYEILRTLMKLGANPDVPNDKGETLLNLTLSFYSLKEKMGWVLDFATSVDHSLKYAQARTFGKSEKEIDALKEIRAKRIVAVSGQSIFKAAPTEDNVLPVAGYSPQ